MRNKLIILIILLLPFSLKAELGATYSISSSTINKLEEWIDKDTLVLIGLDNTIFMPKAKMFSFEANDNRYFIDNLVKLSENMPGYKKIVAAWFQQRKLKLTEGSWPDFIKLVKQKEASVYGVYLTPMHLVNIERKIYEELKSLGIIFTDNVNNQTELIVEQKEPWHSNFYHGIIFTGPYSKSRTIIEFLRVTSSVPKKLLFIDFNLLNMEC